jgi:hypothetical protein
VAHVSERSGAVEGGTTRARSGGRDHLQPAYRLPSQPLSALRASLDKRTKLHRVEALLGALDQHMRKQVDQGKL